MQDEEWRPVPGHPQYEVSDRGRVRSFYVRGAHPARLGAVPQLLRPYHSGGLRGQYLKVAINGRETFIHRLVASAFLGEPREGLLVRHLDDDPTNNDVANLAYGTHSDNRYDAVRNGRHHRSRMTHCQRGHEFTEENTYRPPAAPQWRRCRACRRAEKAAA